MVLHAVVREREQALLSRLRVDSEVRNIARSLVPGGIRLNIRRHLVFAPGSFFFDEKVRIYLCAATCEGNPDVRSDIRQIH